MDPSAETDKLNSKLQNLMKVHAALYMEMVPRALSYGESEGEQAIRAWMRDWGHWRGREMHKGHRSVGYPIDVESAIRHWDNASTHHLGDAWTSMCSFSPLRSVTPIPNIDECFHAQVFREHDFWRWGHVFCDELHQSVVSAYRSGAAVVIPVTLMKKGDESCQFLWVASPSTETEDSEADEDEHLERYRRLWAHSNPAEEAAACMARAQRIGAGLWHFMCAAMETLDGQGSEEACRDALRSASVMRGGWLKELHDDLELPIAPSTFLGEYDQVLSLSEMRSDDRSATAVVASCAMDDVWGELGGRKYGCFYCEESYRAALSSYLPEASLELVTARCRGDDRCEMVVGL